MTKGIDTRERIIRKSAELFNTYGYSGCSLSDIMKATNLKKGGIYNHFKNKDEIALEAFDYSLKKLITRFREKLGAVQTSAQKIDVIIDSFDSLILDPVVATGCPIFNTAMDADQTHPALKEKAKEGMQQLKTYIEIKIEEGKDKGEFKADVDKEEFAALLIMTMEGAVVLTRIYNDRKYVNMARDFLRSHTQQNLLK